MRHTRLFLTAASVLAIAAGMLAPPVLALDGDTQGRRNNDKAAAALVRLGLQSAIVDWPVDPSAPPKKDGSPAGYDPDTWLAKCGAAGLTALVRSGGEASPADEVRSGPAMHGWWLIWQRTLPEGRWSRPCSPRCPSSRRTRPGSAT